MVVFFNQLPMAISRKRLVWFTWNFHRFWAWMWARICESFKLMRPTVSEILPSEVGWKNRSYRAIALSGLFFSQLPTAISQERVGLIYLKLSQILTHIHGPNLWKFQVNQTNRFRDIAVASWPAKKKHVKGFFYSPIKSDNFQLLYLLYQQVWQLQGA